MELFSHGSYQNILSHTGPLSLDELLSLSVLMGGALATAHQRGVIHGDVKPQNIFRSEFNTPALGDFGIAALTDTAGDSDKLRASAHFAAPELIEQGPSALSPAADQYSLAATIYTLATGQRPHATDASPTTREVLQRVLVEPAPRLETGFPESFTNALHMAMARDPQQRHRDLVAFAASMARTQQELGFQPTDIPVGTQQARYIASTPEQAESQEPSTGPTSTEGHTESTISLSDKGHDPQGAFAKSTDADGSPPGERQAATSGQGASQPPDGSGPRRTGLRFFWQRFPNWARVVAVVAIIAVIAVVVAMNLSGGDNEDAADPAETADPQDPADPEDAAEPEDPAKPAETADPMDMMPGEGVSVTMARANWTTGYMQAAIYAQLLEELGFEVSEPADLELAPSDAYLSMAQGEFDFWANSWYPYHDSFVAGEMPDGTLVGDHVSRVGLEAERGGIEGFLTNKSLVDEHGIATLEQLVNDDALFDLYESADQEPGDGVLQIFGCPEDWGCNIVINGVIADRGWSGKVEQIEVGGYDATIAEAVARAGNGIPFIAYTSSPGPYTSHLGLGDQAMWLAQEEGAGTLLGTDVCTNDPCNLLTAADITVTANNDFLVANPSAARLFELVKISVVDIDLQNARYDTGGENTTEDVNRHAAEWIAANRDTVDAWLAEARSATEYTITPAAAPAPAEPPQPPNIKAIGEPSISGEAWVGKTLIADTSGIEDGNGLDGVSFLYEWVRVDPDGNEVTIEGQATPIYEVAAADPGHSLKVRVSFRDQDGHEEGPLTSALIETKGQIVFHSNRDFALNVYIVNADFTSIRQLTSSEGNDFDPSLSPDGTKIAFTTDRHGSSNHEIYVMDVDGSNEIRLTNNSYSDGDPSWSPDGTRLVFTTNRYGNFEIAIINADGSSGESAERLTSTLHQDRSPSWSPDGSRIAFIQNFGGDFEIAVMDLRSGRVETLTSYSGDDEDPAWSNGGTKIAFSRGRGNSAGILDFDIWIMNPDGSDQVRVYNSSSTDKSPVWSPDDAMIAYHRVRSNPDDIEIIVMKADPSDPDPRIRIDSPGKDWVGSWS